MGQGHDLGNWGEDFAARYLALCGYTCLERGYRRPGGEIDLIVRRGDLLAFVEVKTRGPGSPAAAEAWVSQRKLARLQRIARRWLYERRPSGLGEYRFDVVAISFSGDGRGAVLRHICGI